MTNIRWKMSNTHQRHIILLKEIKLKQQTFLCFTGTFHISQIGTSVGDFSILSYFPRSFDISFIWNLVSGTPSILWEFYLSLIFCGKFWYLFHKKFGILKVIFKIVLDSISLIFLWYFSCNLVWDFFEWKAGGATADCVSSFSHYSLIPPFLLRFFISHS